MTDRPILFSGPMVRAILREIENPGTGKTQTRRVLKPQPGFHDKFRGIYAPGLSAVFGDPDNPREDDLSIRLPSLKTRLWVREAWKTDRHYDDLAPREMGGEEPIFYLADNAVERWGWKSDVLSRWGRHRQAMHMPRWASRITLTVTDVRVQRVQDISEGDAVAEGVLRPCDVPSPDFVDVQFRVSFARAWDDLYAAHGLGMCKNPWVYALTFKPELRNIGS